MHWFVLRSTFVCWNRNMMMKKKEKGADRSEFSEKTEKASLWVIPVWYTLILFCALRLYWLYASSVSSVGVVVWVAGWLGVCLCLKYPGTSLWSQTVSLAKVVKASTSRAEDPGCEFRLWRDFSVLHHTSDLKIGTPVATLPDAWRYRVSAGTGWPGVSILLLGEVESLICNFCLSVAARKIVCAGLSLRYTSMLLGR